MKYDYASSSIDQDRKAAQEVWERVEKKRQESNHDQQTAAGEGQREREGSDEEKSKAAKLMQKNYRAHVGRRTAEGRNLTSSKRFDDGLQQRKLKAAGKEQMDGKNDATSRWHRSVVYAGQLTDGQKNSADLMQQPSEEEEMKALARNDKEREQIKEERNAAKRMEPQYWLEIVDSKHRYASNLKYYHQKWNETDTSENFFHWLDEGEGKHLELDECPRKRLDEERIAYLTAEQRETYRVIVNDSGLLVWAKNGEPLDTSKYHEDLGPEKGGVVPISEARFKEKQEEDKDKIRKAKEAEGSSASSSDFGSSSSSSSDDEVADEIRAGSKAYGDKGGTAGQGKGIKQFKKSLNVWDRAFCHHGVNRWLYVSDLTNGLFVSIKKTGGFQHSSFLFGARVTSAGLIKASDGKLTSLSPLSGHYRAGTMHFKAFVRGLEEEGVDMSSVSISKSVMTIRGIEKYGKFNKSKKALTSRIKSTLTGHKLPEEEQEEKEEAKREKISSQEQGARASGEVRKNGYDSDEDEERLPGEGKRKEDMDDEERTDRGLALLLRAFERGLMKNVEDGEEKEKQLRSEQEVKVNPAT